MYLHIRDYYIHRAQKSGIKEWLISAYLYEKIMRIGRYHVH